MMFVLLAMGAAAVLVLQVWLRGCARRLLRAGAAPTLQNLFILRELEEQAGSGHGDAAPADDAHRTECRVGAFI